MVCKMREGKRGFVGNGRFDKFVLGSLSPSFPEVL